MGVKAKLADIFYSVPSSSYKEPDEYRVASKIQRNLSHS